MRDNQGSLVAMVKASRARYRGGMVNPFRRSLTSTEQLVIDSQNERVVASRSCSLGKLAREAAIPIDKDLHPAWRVPPWDRLGGGLARGSELSSFNWVIHCSF